MSNTPKVQYGSIEKTRAIDENTTMTRVQPFHASQPSPEKIVIKHRHIIKRHDARGVSEILTALFSDPNKLSPKVYSEDLSPKGEYYHLIEEYIVLNLG